jgi:hypothetical protein
MGQAPLPTSPRRDVDRTRGCRARRAGPRAREKTRERLRSSRRRSTTRRSCRRQVVSPGGVVRAPSRAPSSRSARSRYLVARCSPGYPARFRSLLRRGCADGGDAQQAPVRAGPPPVVDAGDHHAVTGFEPVRAVVEEEFDTSSQENVEVDAIRVMNGERHVRPVLHHHPMNAPWRHTEIERIRVPGRPRGRRTLLGHEQHRRPEPLDTFDRLRCERTILDEARATRGVDTGHQFVHAANANRSLGSPSLSARRVIDLWPNRDVVHAHARWCHSPREVV